MGQGSSTQSGNDDIVIKLMREVANRLPAEEKARLGVTGGAELSSLQSIQKVGGLKDLKEYHASVRSMSQQHLIREIAHDFAERMKIPGMKPAGKSVDELLAEMKHHVPDPRPKVGNKKTWSPKESSQVKACEVLGQIINERMNAQVINLGQKPHEICEDVAEVMDTFASGLSSEFAAVRKDAERILKNIDILNHILDRNYNALIDKISRDKDSNVKAETAVIREAHEDIRTELERQYKMLQNMVSVVIEPADRDLSHLLKESKDLKQLVRKIKQYPGSTKFGEKVAYVLTGLRTVAQAAKVVNDALDKLGVSMQQYERVHSGKDLRELLSKKTQEMLDNPLPVLHDYIKAAKAVREYQYMHDDIVKELKSNSKRYSKKGKGEKSAKEGGKINIDKRLRKREEVKKALVQAFNSRLGAIFDQILTSAKGIADAVASGKYRVGDKLEKFCKALDLLPDIAKKNVYYALSGYTKDIESKQEREGFVNAAKYVAATLDDISKDKDYSSIGHFRDMKRGFEDIIKLIHDYSGKFAEGFGVMDFTKKDGAADAEEAKAAIGEKAKAVAQMTAEATQKAAEVAGIVANAAAQTAETLTKKVEGKGECGGDDEEDDGVCGGAEGGAYFAFGTMPEITRMSYSLSKTRDIILYYIRTSKIRQNLKVTSEELKSYSEDYVKILADAIAAKVDEVSRDQRQFLEKMEKSSDPRHQVRWAFMGDDESQPDYPQANKKTRREEFQQYLDLKKRFYKTKIDMYRIAEAVDLYMKNFADAVASHPDSIPEIMRILDKTEVVSRWYTVSSGDLLCNVYDRFPSAYDGHVARYSKLAEYYKDSNAQKEHYYTRVARVCFGRAPALAPAQRAESVNIAGGGGDGLPGNPFLAAPIEKSDEIFEAAHKAMGISMLKNIIAAFVNIGDEFGGQTLSKKIHMSPIQIYHGLMEYIIHSAFSLGLAASGVDTPVQLAPGAPGTAAPAAAGGVAAIAPVDVTEITVPHMGDLPVGWVGGDHTIRDSAHVRIGATGAADLNAAAAGALSHRQVIKARSSSLAMRGIFEPGQRSPYDDDFFRETDQLFVLVIKSIVAKILTTIGVYNMFHRPINAHGLGYFSGLRLILGGAGEGVPKVVPDALELYIRLPLLAEFYRYIFNFEAGVMNANQAFEQISMVPEMDGTFSGLIMLIFDKAKYVQDGGYSDTDIRLMIEEVNKIYFKYKDRKNAVTDIIQEFVAEVNRRYGVIKREDRVRYLRERSKRYEKDFISPEDVTDYALANLDENDDYPRPAPSMSYQTEGGKASFKDHKHKLDIAVDQGHINALRNRIDTLFSDAQKLVLPNDQEEIYKSITLEHVIRARAEELKYAKDDRERFNIVVSAINSLGQFALSALEKSYLLFHETVVAPLNTLHALYLMLTMFRDKVSTMSGAVKAAKDWANQLARNPPVAPSCNGRGGADDLLNVAGNYKDAVPYLHAAAAAPAANDVICVRGRQGLASDARDLTYNDLHGILNAPGAVADAAANERAREFAWRYSLNQSAMMLDLFELLYGHAGSLDKFIDVRFEQAQDNRPNVNADAACKLVVHLDNSKLSQYVQETFAAIRQSFEKFRGLLPKDVLNKYESLQTGANAPSSLYYIEKNLIDELLQGRKEGDIEGKESLERVNLKLQEVLNYLNRKWKVNARGTTLARGPHQPEAEVKELTATGTQVAQDAAANPVRDGSYHEFDREYYKLITYNPFTFDADWTVGAGAVFNAVGPLGSETNAGGAAIAGPVPNLGGGQFRYQIPYNDAVHKGIERVMFNTNRIPGAPGGAAAGAPGYRWPNAPAARSIWFYESERGFRPADSHRSVFVMFNRLVAAYLNQVWDAPSEKVYLTTLNAFANGSFSTAVTGDSYYDDSAPVFTNDITDGGSNGGRAKGVLLRSLAFIIRQLINELSMSEKKKKYLETDLAEIPLYVKERYKANLPVFAKMFSLLMRRCEFLKEMVRAFNVSQYMDAPAPAAAALHTTVAVGGVDAVAPPGTNFAPRREKQAQVTNFMKVLDQVIQGCVSLNQCIKDTLNELADDPKYFELHQNSISEYEAMTGQAPFMPPSSILNYLRNTDYADYNANDDANYIHQPTFKLGDNRFKMLYGTRKVLNSDSLSYEDMPGMKDLVKQHNQSTDVKHHIDDKAAANLLSNYMAIAKYLINAKRYRGEFSVCKTLNELTAPANHDDVYGHVRRDLVWTAAGGAGWNEKAVSPASAAFSLRHRLADVIRLTESNNQREEKRRVVSLLETDQLGCQVRGDRKHMMVYNIIDLNIVPIDLHALARDIPGVYLFNYAWTFDKLMAELFGLNLPELTNRGDSLARIHITDDCARSAKQLFGCMLVSPYSYLDPDVYDFRLASIVRGDLGVEGLSQPKFLGQELYNKALFGELYPGAVYQAEETSPAQGHAHLRGKREVLSDINERSGLNYATFLGQAVAEFLRQQCAAPVGGAAPAAWQGALGTGGANVENTISNAVGTAVAAACRDAAGNWVGLDANKITLLLGQPMPGGLPAETVREVRRAIPQSIPVVVANAAGGVAGVQAPVIAALACLAGEYLASDEVKSELSNVANRALHQNPGSAPTQADLQAAAGGVTPGSIVALTRMPSQMVAGQPFRASDGILGITAAALRARTANTTAALGNVGAVGSGVPLAFIAAPPAPWGSAQAFMVLLVNNVTVPGAAGATLPGGPAYHTLPRRRQREIESANPRYFPGTLHFMTQPDGRLESVDVGIHKKYLGALGFLRFNTKFSRNQFWLTNIQRALRLKLRRDLMWYDQRVVSSHAVLAPSITELYGNDMQPTDINTGRVDTYDRPTPLYDDQAQADFAGVPLNTPKPRERMPQY